MRLHGHKDILNRLPGHKDILDYSNYGDQHLNIVNITTKRRKCEISQKVLLIVTVI